MKLIYFTGNFENLTEVRQFYYKLALIHHPDRGGETATMQVINNEYEYLTALVLQGAYYSKYSAEGKQREQNFSDELQAKINEILKLTLTGCKIEVIGSWIWITGETKPVKDQLKELDFQWNFKKYSWYWHAPGYRKLSKKTFCLDDIRAMFGSQEVERNENKVLQLA